MNLARRRLPALLLLTLLALVTDSDSANAAGPPAAKTPQGLTVLPAAEYLSKVVTPHQKAPLVVNFWATWCEPCRSEMPTLLRTAAKLKAPLVLVSLDSTKDAATAAAFLKKLGATVPAYIAAPGDPQDFINRVDASWDGTVPYTLVYRSDGTIAARLTGEQEAQDFQQAFKAASK